MSSKDLIKALKKDGWVQVAKKGSHSQAHWSQSPVGHIGRSDLNFRKV